MRKVSTRQIGDGKLPNKYWVSVCDDFMYEHEPGSFDWDSDRTLSGVNSKTIAMFMTYRKAREFFDSIPLEQLYDGIIVKTKTIEDRLSGEVAREGLHEVRHFISSFSEDLKFTMKKLKEHGASFK